MDGHRDGAQGPSVLGPGLNSLGSDSYVQPENENPSREAKQQPGHHGDCRLRSCALVLPHPMSGSARKRTIKVVK